MSALFLALDMARHETANFRRSTAARHCVEPVEQLGLHPDLDMHPRFPVGASRESAILIFSGGHAGI